MPARRLAMRTPHVLRGWVVFMVPVLWLGTVTSVTAQTDGGGTPRESANIEPLDVASANHVLKKTYFKTENDGFINLSTTWVNAFSDTTVNCPGPGPCTIAVTVTSQF